MNFLNIDEKVALWDGVHEYARLSYTGKEMPVGRPGREKAVVKLESTVCAISKRLLEAKAGDHSTQMMFMMSLLLAEAAEQVVRRPKSVSARSDLSTALRDYRHAIRLV